MHTWQELGTHHRGHAGPHPSKGPTAVAGLQALCAQLHAAAALKQGTLLKEAVLMEYPKQGEEEKREITSAMQTPFDTIKDLYN